MRAVGEEENIGGRMRFTAAANRFATIELTQHTSSRPYPHVSTLTQYPEMPSNACQNLFILSARLMEIPSPWTAGLS